MAYISNIILVALVVQKPMFFQCFRFYHACYNDLLRPYATWWSRNVVQIPPCACAWEDERSSRNRSFGVTARVIRTESPDHPLLYYTIRTLWQATCAIYLTQEQLDDTQNLLFCQLGDNRVVFLTTWFSSSCISDNLMRLKLCFWQLDDTQVVIMTIGWCPSCVFDILMILKLYF